MGNKNSLHKSQQADQQFDEEENKKRVYTWNPFKVLGAYERDPIIHVPNPTYGRVHYGIHNERSYCEKVDLYNINHPEIMFGNEGTIFTDFGQRSNFRISKRFC